MRLEYRKIDLLTIGMVSILCNIVTANVGRADRWGQEALGNIDSVHSSDQERTSIEVNTYKQNLLQYVLQTDEPRNVINSGTMPYVMDRIYDLLADKTTGKQKRSTPFDVDLIRGLEDHYASQRRMQFWFNTTTINTTEDVIECFFHVYKKRPRQRETVSSPSHVVTVNLYKIIDEQNMFTPAGQPDTGVELLETQQVSAYTSQWIVFQSSLKETVRQWIRHPHKNKGLLLTATDSNSNHVNGTHIDFAQRDEKPESQQPVFVVYTDQERKKNKKHKKKHRKNITYLIENHLNEDSRTGAKNRRRCNDLVGDNSASDEQCIHLLLRQRRSLIDNSVDIDEDLTSITNTRTRRDADQPHQIINLNNYPASHRRRLRRRHGKDLYISANSRTPDEQFCQVKPLYISFQALGWGKWIVAPDGLNANYCDGTCPFPLTSALTASNHAVLQSVSNYYHPNKIKPPCCVPQKLARMSILYYQDENTVTMRNYDNMIVETCGCR